MTDSSWTIDPDIRRAQTLPGAVYSDPAWFELQRERLFARTWHVAGDAGMVREPGQVRPWTLLDGCLDEPLVLVRDRDGTRRCLSNACTHRANLVVEESVCLQTLRCRYHGRRFGLDGRFLSMPEFKDTLDFPSPADDLPQVPLADWGPLLFASLDPAFAFEELIAPLRARLDWLPAASFEPDEDSARDYLVNANWALYCDNYLEGFHIPFVHRGLAGTLDYDAYTTETFAYGSVQIGIGAPGEPVFALPAGHPDEGRAVAAYYFFLFPTTMLNFYPWGLSTNVVQPLSPSRTRVSFRSYVWQAGLREHGAGAGLHQVEMEDEAVVESVQHGVRSRLYHRGRYSPRMEVGVHHFHRLLAAFCHESSDAPGAPQLAAAAPPGDGAAERSG